MASFLGSLFKTSGGSAQVMGIEKAEDVLSGAISGIIDINNNRIVSITAIGVGTYIAVTNVALITGVGSVYIPANVTKSFTVPAGMSISSFGGTINVTTQI